MLVNVFKKHPHEKVTDRYRQTDKQT